MLYEFSHIIRIMNMDHIIRIWKMYTILPQCPHHLSIKVETIESSTEKQKKSELLMFLQCF